MQPVVADFSLMMITIIIIIMIMIMMIIIVILISEDRSLARGWANNRSARRLPRAPNFDNPLH